MTKDVMEVSFPGRTLSMAIHPEKELLSDTIRRQGFYTKRDLALYDLFLKEGDTFLDIGANIGWYSLYAAMKVGPTGTVIAIEPEPKNFRLLEENIRLSGFKNITPVEAAIGGTVGVGKLYKSASNFGDHVVADERHAPQGRESVEIPITTIDEVVAKFCGTAPRFIKIDTQGTEPQVLAGMRSLLALPQKPVLQVEFSAGLMLQRGNSPFEIFAFIEKNGYIPYQMPSDSSSHLKFRIVSVDSLLTLTKETRDGEEGRDLFLIPQEQVSNLIKQEHWPRM